MSALMPMALALVTGAFAGWLLAFVYATAAISRSQERMQRKVRYWQAECARARETAERLGCQLAASDRWASPARRWPSR